MRYHDRVYGIYKESNEQTNKQTKDLLTIITIVIVSVNVIAIVIVITIKKWFY